MSYAPPALAELTLGQFVVWLDGWAAGWDTAAQTLCAPSWRAGWSEGYAECDRELSEAQRRAHAVVAAMAELPSWPDRAERIARWQRRAEASRAEDDKRRAYWNARWAHADRLADPVAVVIDCPRCGVRIDVPADRAVVIDCPWCGEERRT